MTGGPGVGVLLPAAGLGLRLGPGRPKALRTLLGEPLLVHAVRGLREVAAVGPIVVAAPGQDVEDVEAMLAAFPGVTVVAGGVERPDSVRAALAAVPAEVRLVLVHDAARCLTPPRLVEAVIAALLTGAEAVVPVVPVADTVKSVRGDLVTATIERSSLRAVQTPQGFTRVLLERAHAAGAPGAHLHTDDAGLVEALGVAVRTVPGDEEAFKVTRPLDLEVAQAVLQRRRNRP